MVRSDVLNAAIGWNGVRKEVCVRNLVKVEATVSEGGMKVED